MRRRIYAAPAVKGLILISASNFLFEGQMKKLKTAVDAISTSTVKRPLWNVSSKSVQLLKLKWPFVDDDIYNMFCENLSISGINTSIKFIVSYINFEE